MCLCEWLCVFLFVYVVDLYGKCVYILHDMAWQWVQWMVEFSSSLGFLLLLLFLCWMWLKGDFEKISENGNLLWLLYASCVRMNDFLKCCHQSEDFFLFVQKSLAKARSLLLKRSFVGLLIQLVTITSLFWVCRTFTIKMHCTIRTIVVQPFVVRHTHSHTRRGAEHNQFPLDTISYPQSSLFEVCFSVGRLTKKNTTEIETKIQSEEEMWWFLMRNVWDRRMPCVLLSILVDCLPLTNQFFFHSPVRHSLILCPYTGFNGSVRAKYSIKYAFVCVWAQLNVYGCE